MSLHLKLKTAKSEEDVKDAYIKALGLRGYTKGLIDRASELQGKSRSAFILEAACDRAQEVVLDQVFFSLDADKFKQFTAFIDTTPGPNPGLERLRSLMLNSKDRQYVLPLTQ